MVGAIADVQLDGTPEGKTVAELLEGLTLAEAATLPDEIKSWDHSEWFYLPRRPKLYEQLHAYFEANKEVTEEGDKAHHAYHYCDIPVGAASYESATRGKREIDIVHIIPLCAKVLRGEVPESNERKITKPVALILLAHFLGDIHQPLHVGALYFNVQQKKAVNGESDPAAIGDQGGNTITLSLPDPKDSTKYVRGKSLHSFWDGEAVQLARSRVTGAAPKPGDEWETVQKLAQTKPTEFVHSDVKDVTAWTVGIANESLKLSTEAHDKLDFTEIGPSSYATNPPLAKAEARPKKEIDYRQWAGDVTKLRIQLAGWRLADLLRSALAQP